jgi:hypothetical protein
MCAAAALRHGGLRLAWWGLQAPATAAGAGRPAPLVAPRTFTLTQNEAKVMRVLRDVVQGKQLNRVVPRVVGGWYALARGGAGAAAAAAMCGDY